VYFLPVLGRVAGLLTLAALLPGCALSFDQFDPVADAGPGLLCPAGSWQSVPGSATTLPICERLTQCTASEYESVAPTETSDRECAALTVCPARTYATVPATATSDRSCSYLSCLDLLMREPSTPDGVYDIDPDGVDGAAPVSVTCDMTTDGGGWTVISQEDFNTEATGWSDPRISTCGTVIVLGGGLGFGAGASAEKVYPLLGIPHGEARLSLKYWRFDSWDGEIAIVRVDGVDVFAMASGGFSCGTAEPGQELAVAVDIVHVTDTLTVTATSTLDEPGDNESFGIDDLDLRIR
jgi:hypothetical protein